MIEASGFGRVKAISRDDKPQVPPPVFILPQRLTTLARDCMLNFSRHSVSDVPQSTDPSYLLFAPIISANKINEPVTFASKKAPYEGKVLDSANSRTFWPYTCACRIETAISLANPESDTVFKNFW